MPERASTWTHMHLRGADCPIACARCGNVFEVPIGAVQGAMYLWASDDSGQISVDVLVCAACTSRPNSHVVQCGTCGVAYFNTQQRVLMSNPDGTPVAVHMCSACRGTRVECGYCGTCAQISEATICGTTVVCHACVTSVNKCAFCCTAENEYGLSATGTRERVASSLVMLSIGGLTLPVCNQCLSSFGPGIHNYSFKPRPRFHAAIDSQLMEPPREKTYGLEIEVHGLQQYASELLRTFSKREEHFYLKYDSSVDGFEIVTHPFTMGMLQNKLNLPELLGWLSSKGFRSDSRNYNCGLHVHAQKDMLGKISNIWATLTMPTLLPTVFRAIAERSDDSMARFAKIFTIADCLNLPRGDDVDWSDISINRHTVINPLPRATVEFRYPPGTLDAGRILQHVLFVECVMDFVAERGCEYFLHELRGYSSARRAAEAGTNQEDLRVNDGIPVVSNRRVLEDFSTFVKAKCPTTKWTIPLGPQFARGA